MIDDQQEFFINHDNDKETTRVDLRIDEAAVGADVKDPDEAPRDASLI